MRLLNTKSVTDKGTLAQLLNLLFGTSVPKEEPIKNVKAAEDFLHLVLISHIIVAAEKVQPISKTGDVMEVAKRIVNEFCDLAIGEQPNHVNSKPDCILTYSKEFMTLSMLWLGYHDAIQEGDGIRVKRYWKFMLLLFKASNRKNYAIEAAKFLIDEQLLSTRLSTQLKYSHFINDKGRQGCNIDLHMEHMNRSIKASLRNIGANFTAKAIDS